MEFKCRLRIIFAEKEIRQKDFSKTTGISQSTLSALVNNTKLPTFPTAYKIAKALNMYMEEIWIKEEVEWVVSKRKKTNLRIVKEIYGDRKIEEVFEELYEKIYGLKVKVRRKTSVKLVAEKQQEKKYTQE